MEAANIIGMRYSKKSYGAYSSVCQTAQWQLHLTSQQTLFRPVCFEGLLMSKLKQKYEYLVQLYSELVLAFWIADLHIVMKKHIKKSEKSD